MNGRASAELVHSDIWRALAALPAVVCSGVVVLVVAGGLGQWAMVVWLGCGAITMTRAGERWVVRLGWGFRRLGSADRALLKLPWMEVLERTGITYAAVSLYLQRGPTVNAYAVGGRTVAVSSGLLDAYRAGRLDQAGVAAVLAHDLATSRSGERAGFR
jgi:STE24 endopeptidase